MIFLREKKEGKFEFGMYKDYIVEIYPIDAMKLNTSIMIDLIQKELL